MTSQDLAYWLQGAFEIIDVEEISKEQREIITRHADLVLLTAKSDTFALTIKTIASLGDPIECARLIKILTASQFEHVIDPKHPNPVQANEIHHKKQNDVAPTVYRC